MPGTGGGINSRLKNAARAVTSALNKDSRETGDCDDDTRKAKVHATEGLTFTVILVRWFDWSPTHAYRRSDQ